MSYPVTAVLGPLLPAFLALLVSRRHNRYGPIAAALIGSLGALILRMMLAAQPMATDPATGREIVGRVWELLGRPLLMSSDRQSLLLFIYSVAIVLFLLSALWPQGAEFVPAGLILLSFTAAALMLTPISFGIALLLVIIALAAVLLQSGRVGIAHGPLWFLLFTGLGVPLTLLAAWMLDTQPGALYGSIWRLLLGGLVLLLAGFPFLFWVRPVIRFAAPFPTIFAFSLVPLVILFLVIPLTEISPAVWQDSPLRPLMGQAGAIIAGVAVALTLYARDWPGLVAYTLLADLGAVLLALSLGPAGLPVAGMIILLRGVSLLLGGLGMSLLQSKLAPSLPAEPPPDYQTGAGLAWKQPLGALLFALGMLSLAGFPLTPGFSGRWELLSLLWPESVPFALILILATVSSLIGVVRAGRYMVGGPGRESFSVRGYAQGLDRPGQISNVFLLVLLFISYLFIFFPQLLVHIVSQP